MNSTSDLFRWSLLDCMLIAFCLFAGTSTALASTVYESGNYCWNISPHCPDEIPNYESCPGTHPYYCPWDWSYEVVDSVSVSSSTMTLTTNVASPAFGAYGTTGYFTAEEFGAYDDSFFRVWFSIYNYQTNTWGGWNLWKSGWDLGTFDWWDTLGNPTLFATYADARANYVNNWDAQSSIYYFYIADRVTDLSFTTTPASPVAAGQQVSLSAVGYGAPLGDYLYRFNVGTFTNGSYTGTQVLQNPSAYSTCTWTVPPYDASKAYMLYVEADTDSQAQAIGFGYDQIKFSPTYYVLPPTLSINTSSLPEAMDGVPYSTVPLAANGGQSPYTWLNINSGQPTTYIFPGLSIDTNTGIISGIPNGWNENFPLTIQVTDSLNSTKTKDLNLVVHPRPYIQNVSLPNGTVGSTYNNNQSLTLIASGGNHTYTWSANNLPSWLSFNTSTHTISVNGTPQATGTYSFTINAISMGVSASMPFTITINTLININTSVLTEGQLGKPYSQYLSASNGTGTYTWSYQSGTIPPGLTLSSSGLVSGTPTANGDYSFTVMAVDGINVSAVRQISQKIVYAPVSITTAATLPPGNSDASYSKFITATGGDGTYSWSKTGGTFPTGISLNSSTGELYGTPTTGGDYSFTITANDGVNPTASKAFTLRINGLPSITTTSIANGQYGVAYSQGLAASGGSGGYTWSLLVAPVGLGIDANSGIISGIPFDVGQFSITVQATDAQNPLAFVTKTFTANFLNATMQQNTQCSNAVGDEISADVPTCSTSNVISGTVSHDQELFTTKGGMQNIAISLFYKSLPDDNGSLGIGWSHNYNIFLTIYSGDGSIVLNSGSGNKNYYTKSGSNYVSPPGDFSVLTAVSGGYKITYRDGSSYNFDSAGKITSIADRFGNAISFAYTGSDLTGISDPAYRNVTITYDQTTTPHRISTVTDPSGNIYNFSYVGTNCSNRLCRVTNPAATSGATQGYWEYQYNAAGLLQSKRDPNSNTSQYSYYADKRMQTATDPNGRTRTIVYPTTTDTLRTSTLTEKDGGQWLYTFDVQNGVIKQKTDPNGKVTDFYYYPSGSIKAKSEPKDGATRITTFYSYDSYGNLLIETEPADLNSYSPAIDPDSVTDITTLTSKSPPIKAARHYIYDNAAGHYDRITSVADERGTTTRSTTFAYTTDGYGEVVTATATPGNYATSTSHITVTRKNANGSVRQLVDANGKTTNFTYQPDFPSKRTAGIVGLLATIVAPDNTRTSFTSYYRGNPYITEFLDSTGLSSLRIYTDYDSLNRLIAQEKYSSTLGSFDTGYSYDLMGNLTSIVDAELHETKYEYNYNRQITKITDAKLNDTVFRYSGSEQNGIDQLVGVYDANVAKNTPLESQPHTAYIYDQLGRLEIETDPLGKKVYYTYYDNGLVKEKYDATSSTPGTLLVTFYYNNRGQVTDKVFTDGTGNEHYTYTANGQLETAANQHISYTYAYYDDGILKSVTDTTNNRQIYYDQYDNNGQRKQVTVLKGAGADQRIITYDYDTANRPWHITSTAGTFTYGYDNSGRRQTVTYPNQLTANYVFDDLNRLTSLTHKNGTTPFATFNYTQFDNVGNRKTVTGSKNETYGYDELYRVTSVTATKSEGFAYDPAGNRLTGPGASDTTYQSNSANQMTQGRKLTYGYDNRGNQTTKTVLNASDKTWTRTWDYNNRLTQEQKVKGTEVKTVTYKYDPFGRRIEKKFQQTKGGVTETETTNYLYDNEDIVVEYFNTADGTEKTFVTHGHGIDEPLALERGGSNFYFHADGLGSITHITNAAKAVVQSYTYDAYGMATPSTDFRNSYQHTGREYDWETGSLYMRERTRDLMDGNFTSKDRLGFAAGDTNLYRYVGGNVTNKADPFGLYDQMDLAGDALNFAAGFGNAVSFGGTTAIAQKLMNSKDAATLRNTKQCSGAFKAGEWASLGLGAGRLAYAGLAKGASIGYAALGANMQNAAAASAFRNGLKKVFRANPWSKFRVYPFEKMVEKYGTAEAIIEATGRTNTGINLVGGAATLGGVKTLEESDD